MLNLFRRKAMERVAHYDWEKFPSPDEFMAIKNSSKKKSRVVFITGAGISEPAIPTIRLSADYHGSGDDIEFYKNTASMADDRYIRFFKLNKKAKPTTAHQAISEFCIKHKDTTVITTNIDSLHEKSGCNAVHLHGCIMNLRNGAGDVSPWDGSSKTLTNDFCVDFKNNRLEYQNIRSCLATISMADFIVVIGSSLQEFPVSLLLKSTKKNSSIIYINKVKLNAPFPSHGRGLIGDAELITPNICQLISEELENAKI